MKRFALITLIALFAGFAGQKSAEAQNSFDRGFIQKRIVSPTHDRPRLGVNGYATCRGYKITRVSCGSVAERMGLECGDIIMSINGCDIDSTRDLVNALDKAACKYNGRINLLVENGRWTQGCSYDRYVRLRGNLFR